MADVQAGVTVKAKVDDRDAQTGFQRLLATTANLNQAWEFLQKTAGAVSGAINQTVGAAVEQERIFSRLQATLDRTGVGYEKNAQALSEFFAEQQRLTRFGDDATAAAVNQIALLTGALEPSIDDLMDFTRTAQDVAEATGRDLAAASQAVGRAAAGNVESLNELLPAQREMIQQMAQIEDPAERGAAAMALLRQEFEGAAEAADPFDRALSRIRNAIGDIREAFGGFITQSAPIQEALHQIATLLDAVALAFDPASQNASIFGDALRDMARIGITGFSELAQFAFNTFQQLEILARRLEAQMSAARGGRVGEIALDVMDFAEAVREIEEAGTDPSGRFDISRGVREQALLLRTIVEAEAGAGRALMGVPQQNIELIEQVTRDIQEGILPIPQTLAQFESIGRGLAGVSENLEGATDRTEAEIADLLLQTEQALAAVDEAEGDGDGGGVQTFAPSGARGAASDAGAQAAEDFNTAFVAGFAELFEEIDKAIAAVDIGQELFRSSEEFEAAFADRIAPAFEQAKIEAELTKDGITDLGMAINDLKAEPVDEITRALLDQKEAMIEAREASRELWDDFRTSTVDSFQSFALTSTEAFGVAAEANVSFVDTAREAAFKGAGSMASAYGRLFFLQGSAFLLIPGLRAQGAGLIAAGLGLSALGGFLGARGAELSAGGGGGARGGGGADLSDNFRGATTGRDELRIDQRIFLDGEPIARNTQRHMELGGAARL